MFEVCAKVDELNVAQIGNIVCAIRFESHVLRNRLDQCNLLRQLINFIKGQREVIQLRRSIEPSGIIAEFILNCCTGFLHSNQMLRIHKRFIPKLKAIVQFLVHKNSRVARFLRFFQQLLHTLITIIRVVQQSRIDFQHIKELFQLCHCHLCRSCQIFEIIQVQSTNARHRIQIRCTQNSAIAQSHRCIARIYHGQEDDRCKEVVDLEMLIFVLIIVFDIKDIRIIDNALRRQLFQLVNIVSCILGTFRSNLIAIQNTKTLEHQGRSLRFTTCKIVKRLPYIFCYIFPSHLCFHCGIIRIFSAEIFIQTQGSRQINGVLKIHIPVIASAKHFDHLPLLPIILDIKTGVLVFTQILNQLFAIHRCFVQIRILIFAFADLRLCIRSREDSQNFLELCGRFEEKVNFVLQIFHRNTAGTIWRHDMDIEIALRLCSTALSRQTKE